MPEGPLALLTRLESTSNEMVAELRNLPRQPRALIHLAGMSVVKACDENPELARAINVEGALKWYEAAGRVGIEHFVQVSTSHVYGRPRDDRPLRVDSPVDPVTVYGKTKLESESELLGRNGRPKVTIARVFSVLSKAMREGYLLTSLHKRARSRDFSPIPGFSNVRDFLWAEEVCERLLKVAKNPGLPSIVLICSGRGQKVCDIARTVFEEYGLEFSKIQHAADARDGITRIVGVPTPLD
jgi:nucleoside-diphosphate-sugar epimerase